MSQMAGVSGEIIGSSIDQEGLKHVRDSFVAVLDEAIRVASDSRPSIRVVKIDGIGDLMSMLRDAAAGKRDV